MDPLISAILDLLPKKFTGEIKRQIKANEKRIKAEERARIRERARVEASNRATQRQKQRVGGPGAKKAPTQPHNHPSPQPTLYEDLEVSPNASPETIRAAFVSLSKKYHPDVGGDAQRYKRITHAWSVLKDDGKKREYDGGLKK